MHLRRRLQLAIVGGGAIGSLARAGLDRTTHWDGHGWPWATYTANVLGAFLLGLFVTRLQERLPPSSYPRPLLGTGLCGALTTFSTLQIEVIELFRDHRPALAAGYLAATLAAGLAAVYVGTVLGRNSRLG